MPEAPSAAKALNVDAMMTKPLPVGAPLAPKLYVEAPFWPLPHALIVPDASSAAKALVVDAMDTKPLPVGGGYGGR